MLFSDLNEAKAILEIDPCNKAEDKKLTFILEWVSSLIEEILNRPNMSKKERTEYYQGTGSQKLLLRSRPVFTTPDIQLWLHEGGHYGSTSDAFGTGTLLTYGSDYFLKIDQEDGTSRSGILFRLNNFWPKPSIRQGGYLSPFVWEDTGSIKVTYTAGYTVDSLPTVFRMACNLLIARMRYILPLGLELSSEHYEERSIAILGNQRRYLTSLVASMLLPYRNWKF